MCWQESIDKINIPVQGDNMMYFDILARRYCNVFEHFSPVTS